MEEITVIIPAINEEQALQQLFNDLSNQVDVNLKITVADGGSSDNSEQVCLGNNVEFQSTPSGRAKQMNAVAKQKSGLLLFLHADTRLTDPCTLKRALWVYQSASQHTNETLAGHFPLKFYHAKSKQGKSLFWRYAEEKTGTNRKDSINGDQGLFIHKEDFETLGGFNEKLHFLEDQDFADKVFKNGKWIVFPNAIFTSARRFEEEGEHRLYILMSIIMGLYKTGFKDFFELSPGLYRQQKHVSKLYLTPFFLLIIDIKINSLGFKNTVIAWYKVGEYIRSHSWQMFYFFDQLLRGLYGQKIYPLLWFHDNVFEKFIKNPPCNAITAVVGFTWFIGVLFPVYWILERPELKKMKSPS